MSEISEAQALYEDLLAKKLEWFAACEKDDAAMFGQQPDKNIRVALEELRHFAPAATHWAINVMLSRLSAPLDPSSAPTDDRKALEREVDGFLDQYRIAVEDQWEEESQGAKNAYGRIREGFRAWILAARSPDREAGSGTDEGDSADVALLDGLTRIRKALMPFPDGWSVLDGKGHIANGATPREAIANALLVEEAKR